MATQEQGNETAAAGKQPEKAKKATSPVRTVVGLVLVVVLSGVAYIEFTNNQNFKAAVAALDVALEKEDAGLLSDQDVQSKVGRAPDGPAVKEAGGTKMSYTFQGVFKRHRIMAYYNNEAKPHLLRYATE